MDVRGAMTNVPSRVLTCNGCGDDVEVFGAVSGIDPDRYRCVVCLDPRHATAPPQLTLVKDARVEHRERYDPAQAEIPF